MTINIVPADSRRRDYVLAGGETVLPVPFPFYAAADIQVFRDRAGVITALANPADYVLTGDGQQGGGTVTLTASALAGDIITVLSVQPLARTTKFTDGGALPAKSLNDELNRLVISQQQLEGSIRATLRLPPGEAPLGVLPPRAARAGRVLGFDSLGAPVPVLPLPGSVVISPYAETLLGAADAPAARALLLAAPATIAPVPGGAALPIQNVLGQRVDVRSFGAVGNGVTDDRAAIQAAINHVQSLGGGEVMFGAGIYALGPPPSGSACLQITGPVMLTGVGRGTFLRALPTVSISTDMIQVTPAGFMDYLRIRNIVIGTENFAAPNLRHGIHFVLNPGCALTRFWITDCIIDPILGRSVFLTNSNLDGLFCGGFQRNVFFDGISLIDCGDSIWITENTLAGVTRDKFAIEIKQVVGASEIVIDSNNITNRGGAVWVQAGHRGKITNNNIEQQGPRSSVTDPFTAMIVIQGAFGEPCLNWEISGNFLGAFTGSGVVRNIYVGNAIQTRIENNNILSDSTYPIEVGSAGVDTIIGVNTYGTALIAPLVDAGVGTVGSVRPLTLLNSWANHGSGFAPVAAVRGPDGTVRINGTIAAGVTTGDTIIAVLPAGFRPANSVSFPVITSSGLGHLLVDPSGNLAVISLPGNGFVSLDSISFAPRPSGPAIFSLSNL